MNSRIWLGFLQLLVITISSASINNLAALEASVKTPKNDDHHHRLTGSSVPRSSSSNINGYSLIEGDILVRKKATIEMKRNKSRRFQSSSAANSGYLWPDGIVPFLISPDLEPQRCLLQSAMLQIMINTCIRFRDKTEGDKYYTQIERNSTGCFASIGRDIEQDYAGFVNLHEGCYDIGTVVHELMHVIGFHHLHMRHDRDQYIIIHEQNIDPFKLNEFELNDARNERLVSDWEYESIMLYGSRAFSRDGSSMTMEAVSSDIVLEEVHRKSGLTRLDVAAVRQLYRCDSQKKTRHLVDDQQLIDWFLATDKVCADKQFSIVMYLP